VTPELNHASASSRVCLISIAGEVFAIALRNVREVLPVESVTPIPGAPPVLVGVMNLSGMVIPLVDLRLMMGLPAAGPSPQYVVVIHHGVDHVGMLVDQVPEICDVLPDQIHRIEDNIQARPSAAAVLRLDQRTASLLEVPMLLAEIQVEWAVGKAEHQG